MKERTSEVNRSYKVSENRWVLTLARKTAGAHQQHAFFILEGYQNNKPTIWFMDFVGRGLAPSLPNIMNGSIRTKQYSDESEENLIKSPLLFRCELRMMDLKEGDNISTLSWFIESDVAINLIQTIDSDKKSPPVFNIFGDKSVFTKSSGFSSSKDRGHNCFTYAKEKIETLNDPTIKIQGDWTAYCMDHIMGITSLTLKFQKKSGCGSYFWKAAAVMGIAAGFYVTNEISKRYYLVK